MNDVELSKSGVFTMPVSKDTVRVLVVDDEVLVRTLLTDILEEEGYAVETAENGQDGIRLLEDQSFDMVISDIVMPKKNGIEVLVAAKRIDPNLPVIMITGYPSVDTVIRLVKLGSSDYITKPFNVDLIRVTVAKVLELKKLNASNGKVPEDEPMSAEHDAEVMTSAVFVQLLEKELQRSARRGHVCSLLLCEIDNFADSVKKGRTTLGDEIFNIFSKVVKEQISPGDIIGKMNDAQIGLLLPESARAEANAIAQNICKKAEWQFTVSIGGATYPRDAQDTPAIQKVATNALKAAKSRGGNTVLMPR
jgi:diguanylate cyclase (GGDEF)-like protein